MPMNPDYIRRRNEFFALSDFKRFVYPILQERMEDLTRKLIDHGGDEARFRILEIERLIDGFESVGTDESKTNL